MNRQLREQSRVRVSSGVSGSPSTTANCSQSVCGQPMYGCGRPLGLARPGQECIVLSLRARTTRGTGYWVC